MKYNRIFCVALALSLTAAMHGQTTDSRRSEPTGDNELSIGMQFMTHGEMRGGGLPEADANETVGDRANFLFGRTRLTVNYRNSCVETKAVIQNSAVWGMKGNQSLGLYEGWAKVNAGHGLFVQMGRVALAYDDERIIGTNDFATAALSHDILRLGYEGHGHKLHALLAYNQNASNILSGTYYVNGAQYYKTMQTFWYHYDFPEFPLGFSALCMNIGIQAGEPGNEYNPPRTEYQRIIGGYMSYHPEYLTVEGSYYRQGGNHVNEYNMAVEIDAWMASAKLTVKPSDRYSFELGYDYLSGDDYVPVIRPGALGMVRHDLLRGFTPVYGSRTKFYGMMDYFYESAYINGFTPGLQNAFIGVNFKPVAKLSCSISYHYLAVTSDLDNLGKTLGHDIDMQASYRFNDNISFMAGYTQMAGTETMDRLKQATGDKHANWGWCSLVISPQLFTNKW